MRILLIDPTIARTSKQRLLAWMPLGLAYLAACLRQEGHEVTIHNRLTSQFWGNLSLEQTDQVTEQLLRDTQPELIGISGVTASFGDMVFLTELARRTCPGARLVLGGPHATTAPQEALERLPQADCLLVGEGEERLVQLAGGQPPADLPGMYWRDASGDLLNTPWIAPDWELDSLPPPARDLMDMNRYLRQSRGAVRGSRLRSTSLLSGRGCHFRCAFCSEPAYSVRGYRAHSPEHTVAEAEDLLARYRIPMLVFLDENFSADRERVLRICELWHERGLAGKLRFTIQARADAVDGELLAELKRAGCYHIELGLESGSDRVLKLMRKGVTAEQNRRAAELVKRSGIRLQVNIICGVPGETEQELQASLALVEEVQPDALSLLPYLPLPGTEFVRQLAAEGRLEPDFWALTDRHAATPQYNFSAMDDDCFTALRQAGKELSRRLNTASRDREAPWWQQAARRVKRRLTRR